MTVLNKLDKVEYLLKHQPGRHDQKTHGHRAGGGEGSAATIAVAHRDAYKGGLDREHIQRTYDLAIKMQEDFAGKLAPEGISRRTDQMNWYASAPDKPRVSVQVDDVVHRAGWFATDLLGSLDAAGNPTTTRKFREGEYRALLDEFVDVGRKVDRATVRRSA